MDKTPLFDRQKEAVVRMLNLGVDVGSDVWSDTWKVVIFDEQCRDILSQLLKVGELRRHGVTLNLLLNSTRKPVADVSAVYFVQPSPENVERICADLKAHLYNQYYFNFASSIPRPLLERLADAAVESDSASAVRKVFDQHLDFVCLEPTLFTCNRKRTFLALHDPKQSDADAQRMVEDIAEQLFSVVSCIGTVPVIRCARGKAADMVASVLDARLRTALAAGTVPAEHTLHRPLLVLLDRDADLSVLLHHPWTYQALIDDVLGIQLNRTHVPPTDPAAAAASTYDLDYSDAFWRGNAHCPYPSVAETIDRTLKQYVESSEAVRALTGDGAAAAGTDRTRTLMSAVDALPELSMKKAEIDKHMAIATAVMEQVKTRQLHLLFALEDKILTRGAADRGEIMSAVREMHTTPQDKLRLYLLWHLSTGQADADIERELAAAGADLTPLAVLKQLLSAASVQRQLLEADRAGSGRTGGGGGGGGGGLTQLLGRFTDLAATITGSQSFESLVSVVKSVMPGSRLLPVSRVVDNLCELRPGTEADTFRYLDPKQAVTDESRLSRVRNPFRHVIVFMVGGGSFVEYQNLKEYERRSNEKLLPGVPKRTVTYGATEMLNASAFLAQLSELAHRMGVTAPAPPAAAAAAAAAVKSPTRG